MTVNSESIEPKIVDTDDFNLDDWCSKKLLELKRPVLILCD